MRRALALNAFPIVLMTVVAGAWLTVPSQESVEPADTRIDEKLLLDAHSALTAAESRHQRRFSEALDPEFDEAALQERINLLVEMGPKGEQGLPEFGFELFIRDRSPGRKPRSAVETNRCASCHSRLGPGGAGGLIDDYFGGRNPPSLRGAGLLEELGVEMTKELREDARAGRPLEAKGVSFGAGSVKDDLLVRPFGRGKWATIAESIRAMSPAMGVDLFPNEVTAIRAWIVSLPAPGIEPPDAGRMPDLFERFQNGEITFRTLGCAKCHVPEFKLADGRPVRAYTDLKVHDLGGQPPVKLVTAPLWGLAGTPPWLHDGSALASLSEAILAHEGEAQSATRAYEKLDMEHKGELHVFLLSLAPAPKIQVAGQ